MSHICEDYQKNRQTVSNLAFVLDISGTCKLYYFGFPQNHTEICFQGMFSFFLSAATTRHLQVSFLCIYHGKQALSASSLIPIHTHSEAPLES